MKSYEGKYGPVLVYTSFIKAIARVRRFGIEKHGNSEDWRTTPEVDHYNAMERHIREARDGNAFDDESHLLHLAHAATCIMFEIERLEQKPHRNFIVERLNKQK